MRIFVLRRPDSPAAALHCCIETGSIHETEHPGSGLSHFLEHMLFQGCDGFPGTAAADRIDALGGDINAYTSFDHTVYHAEVPTEHMAPALDVLCSMVRRPEFPAERFAMERDVILRERDMGRDNPDRRLGEHLWELAFRRHPVRFPIIGYRDQIERVDREMMIGYYQSRYTPGRCFWVVVSPEEPEKVFDLLAARMSDWERGSLIESALPAEPKQRCGRALDASFEDPLGRLSLGIVLPGAAELSVPAVDILTGVLALGDGSQLVRVLRQERELAIALGSYSYTRGFGGLLGVVAHTTPGKMAPLEKAMLQELDAMRRGKIDADAVRREQNQQLAEHLRESRSSNALAATLIGAIQLYETSSAADEYLNQLQKVSLDDVRAAAAEFLIPERFNLVRQCPAGKISARPVRSPSAPERLDAAALSSNVPFYVASDRRRPLTDLVLVLPGGSLFESPEEMGAARLTANLLTCGAGRYDEGDFAAALDRCGAELSASAGVNSLIIQLNVPTARLDRALELLRLMLHEPHFDSGVLARECANAMEALESRALNPRVAAELLARRNLYGDHPCGRCFDGGRESLANMNRAHIAAFYASTWRKKQARLMMGGSGDPERYRMAAEALMEGLPWVDGARPLPPEPVFPTREIRVEKILPREQMAVFYGVPTIAHNDPAEAAFDVLNLAENGLSSRLFKRVREDNGLAYSAGYREFMGFQRGIGMFFGVTEPARGEEVMTLLREEVLRLGETGLEQGEFDAACAASAFSCRRRIESGSSLLTAAALEAYYGNDPNRIFSRADVFSHLRLEEVNRALKQVFQGAVGVGVFVGGGVPGRQKGEE